MVAHREPEDDRRGQEVAVAAIAARGGRDADGGRAAGRGRTRGRDRGRVGATGRPRARPIRRLGVRRPHVRVPLDEEPQEDRYEREVEGVRLGVRGDRPDDRGQGHRQPGGDPERHSAGQPPDEVDGEAGRHRQAQPGQEVHPERRLAERLEDDRRKPADQDVGREAGRMGRAHERPDDLQLARVPERHAGKHRQPGRKKGDERDRERRAKPGSGHHPSDRLQTTPHRLIASDATTRLMARSMPHLRRTASRSNPSATSSSANGAAVVAEAVPELDPALAEVHEVERGDGHDRDDGAGHDPVPPEPAEDRDGEQVCRARQQDAHPRVARDGQRAADVEQPAHGAGVDADRDRCEAQGVRQMGGQEVRGPEQGDAEVLEQVARVLDGPVRVIAERRVAGRLEAVQVVVGGADELPGRHDVVQGQAEQWDGGAQPGRPGAPAPAAPGADEHEERRTEDDRQPRRAGEPEQQPGGELAAVDRHGGREPAKSRGSDHDPDEARATDRARCRPAAGRVGRVGPARPGPRPHQGRPRSRANVSPTATMCAWYQVVASCAVNQKTVPKREEDRRREPDDEARPAIARSPTSRSRRRRRPAR